MSHIEQIGNNIRLFREKKGITQKMMADSLMLSFQAISAWERGISIPDLENVVRIADYFGVSVDDLLLKDRAELFVAIDGGGTKTEFVLFQKDGIVRNVVRLEGSNPNDKGIENSISVLIHGVEDLLKGQKSEGIFAGIAGSSISSNKKAILTALAERFRTKVYVDTDAANVLSCGADPENVIAVICGTGSCVFVRKGSKMYRLGGWGYIFDQAGSAYDIGRDAIRVTLAVEDGLQEPSLLTSQIVEALGGMPFDLISMIHQKGRPFIAGFAKTVISAAEAGDTLATEILRNNASRLGSLISTAVSRYGKSSQIVATGGMMKSDLFRGMIEEASGYTLSVPDCPPVYGACIEALRSAGISVDDRFYQNFMDSYRRVLC